MLRTLTAADLYSALGLSAVAGWNQTEADWNRLLKLDSTACFCIECDGSVVATTTLVSYADEMAWLGMVLTHPEYRKRGFARRLVECALESADSRNIPSIKLDATEQGLALYRSLGFREEQAIERWSGVGRPSQAVSPSGLLSPAHLRLDREAFGANRYRLLDSLSKTAFVQPEAFAMSRIGSRAAQLGPCISTSAASAQRLLANCLSTHPGDWYWDLLPSNSDAVKIAREFHFKPVRRLIRMVRGEDRKSNQSMIYAAGGFELG